MCHTSNTSLPSSWSSVIRSNELPSSSSYSVVTSSSENKVGVMGIVIGTPNVLRVACNAGANQAIRGEAVFML
jgi:hypothetical protein